MKNINELSKAIAKKKSLFYYFPGDEYFNKNYAINLIKDKILKKNEESLNFLRLYGDDFQFSVFIDFATSHSFFSDDKLILILNSNKINVPTQKKLLQYFENPAKQCSIIFETPNRNENKSKINLNKKLFQYLKKNALYYFFWPPFDSDIRFHINRKMKSAKKKITHEAIKFITLISDQNLHLIDNELEKLLLFAQNKETIELSDAKISMGITKSFTVFEIIDFILEEKINIVFNILENDFNFAKESSLLIWGLTKRIFLLLELFYLKKMDVSNIEIIKELKIYQKHFEKYYIQSMNFGEKSLITILDILLQTEFELKSANIENKILVNNLLIKLLKVM